MRYFESNIFTCISAYFDQLFVECVQLSKIQIPYKLFDFCEKNVILYTAWVCAGLFRIGLHSYFFFEQGRLTGFRFCVMLRK